MTFGCQLFLKLGKVNSEQSKISVLAYSFNIRVPLLSLRWKIVSVRGFSQNPVLKGPGSGRVFCPPRPTSPFTNSSSIPV